MNEGMGRDLDSTDYAMMDDDSHDTPFPTDVCGECTHPYRDHDGYSYGPVIREWCNGAGTTHYPLIMEDGEDIGDEHPNCPCQEFVL